MDYCVGFCRKNKEKNAGAKAPDDIVSICKDMGMEIFWIPANLDKNNIFKKIYWDVMIPIFYWFKFLFKISNGDRIIFQHPLYSPKIRKNLFPFLRKQKNFLAIGVIHDLVSLRKFGEISEEEIKELRFYDKLIVHNPSMEKYLVSRGFEYDKLIILDIFDYLFESLPTHSSTETLRTVTIAGNLDPKKCGYLYEMAKLNPELSINLYGIGVDESSLSSNVNYKGSFSPEKLIENISGDFGLVWDGVSVSGCQGKMGEYLKFNNPHKTSLYIVSQLPVITWKNSAIAEFILKNKIGLVIEDLKELTTVVNQIDRAEYNEMKKNVKSLSERLRKGEFTKTAIEKAYL